MKLLSFFKDNKKYFISILKYSNIDDKLENEFSQLYNKCFNQFNDLQTLIDFVGENGLNVMIFDSNKHLIFIVSFVYNYDSKYIEMYNVCKNFESQISTTFLLNNILNYLLKKK